MSASRISLDNILLTRQCFNKYIAALDRYSAVVVQLQPTSIGDEFVLVSGDGKQAAIAVELVTPRQGKMILILLRLQADDYQLVNVS